MNHVGSSVNLQIVRDGDNEYFALQFRLLQPENYEYQIMEPDKSSELVWADQAALSADTIDLFRAVIGGCAAGESYIEIGY